MASRDPPGHVLTVALDALQAVHGGQDTVAGLWSIFAKINYALPDGPRLENIAWRLWFRTLNDQPCSPDHVRRPSARPLYTPSLSFTSTTSEGSTITTSSASDVGHATSAAHNNHDAWPSRQRVPNLSPTSESALLSDTSAAALLPPYTRRGSYGAPSESGAPTFPAGPRGHDQQGYSHAIADERLDLSSPALKTCNHDIEPGFRRDPEASGARIHHPSLTSSAYSTETPLHLSYNPLTAAQVADLSEPCALPPGADVPPPNTRASALGPWQAKSPRTSFSTVDTSPSVSPYPSFHDRTYPVGRIMAELIPNKIPFRIVKQPTSGMAEPESTLVTPAASPNPSIVLPEEADSLQPLSLDATPSPVAATADATAQPFPTVVIVNPTPHPTPPATPHPDEEADDINQKATVIGERLSPEHAIRPRARRAATERPSSVEQDGRKDDGESSPHLSSMPNGQLVMPTSPGVIAPADGPSQPKSGDNHENGPDIRDGSTSGRKGGSPPSPRQSPTVATFASPATPESQFHALPKHTAPSHRAPAVGGTKFFLAAHGTSGSSESASSPSFSVVGSSLGTKDSGSRPAPRNHNHTAGEVDSPGSTNSPRQSALASRAERRSTQKLSVSFDEHAEEVIPSSVDSAGGKRPASVTSSRGGAGGVSSKLKHGLTATNVKRRQQGHIKKVSLSSKNSVISPKKTAFAEQPQNTDVKGKGAVRVGRETIENGSQPLPKAASSPALHLSSRNNSSPARTAEKRLAPHDVRKDSAVPKKHVEQHQVAGPSRAANHAHAHMLPAIPPGLLGQLPTDPPRQRRPIEITETSSDYETTDDDDSWESDSEGSGGEEEDDAPRDPAGQQRASGATISNNRTRSGDTFQRDMEAAARRQKEMFQKLPSRSYSNLGQLPRTRSGVSLLFHPDPMQFPADHPYRKSRDPKDLLTRNYSAPAPAWAAMQSRHSAAAPVQTVVNASPVPASSFSSQPPRQHAPRRPSGLCPDEQSAAYRPKGRPEGVEEDDTESEEDPDNTIQVSASVAHNRLAALMGKKASVGNGHPRAPVPPPEVPDRRHSETISESSSQAIPTPILYQYLPTPMQMHSPTTIRRNVINNELPDELRHNLLWARSSQNLVQGRPARAAGTILPGPWVRQTNRSPTENHDTRSPAGSGSQADGRRKFVTQRTKSWAGEYHAGGW